MRKIIIGLIAIALSSCGTVTSQYNPDRQDISKAQTNERHVERRWESDKVDRPADPPEFTE